MAFMNEGTLVGGQEIETRVNIKDVSMKLIEKVFDRYETDWNSCREKHYIKRNIVKDALIIQGHTDSGQELEFKITGDFSIEVTKLNDEILSIITR
jgi:hypothetical protein